MFVCACVCVWGSYLNSLYIMLFEIKNKEKLYICTVLMYLLFRFLYGGFYVMWLKWVILISNINQKLFRSVSYKYLSLNYA